MVATRTGNRKSAGQIILRMFVSPSALLNSRGVSRRSCEASCLTAGDRFPEVTEKSDYL